MKQQIHIALLSLILFVSTATAQENPACAEHPKSTRDTIKSARAAGRGIKQEHLNKLKNKPEGIPVQQPVDIGGGECPDENTARGAACHAVGSLLYKGEPHCSAVLVAPTMVVTAAHCLFKFDYSKMEFVVGQEYDKPIQRATVYSTGIHEKYDDTVLGVNDIGYVYLNRRITEAQPVTLPEGPLTRSANLSLLHVGYGIAGAVPGARRCVDIPVKDICDDAYSYSTDHMNTCHGDSGGAAFLDIGRQLLFSGLTIWGDDDCTEFGVDLSVGYYRDWIKARMAGAPTRLPPASIASGVRKTVKISPDEMIDGLTGFNADKKFESLYKGKWVSWNGTVQEIIPAIDDFPPGACSITAKSGKKTQLLLYEFPKGCDLSLAQKVEFDGRLARLGPANFIELVLIEPQIETSKEVKEPIATLAIIRETSPAEPIRERRTRDFRLESLHGSWSGRQAECERIQIEAPWSFDKEAPVTFSTAYRNHAGFTPQLQHISQRDVCVPLWAEGFGGVQLWGTTVDAGSKGVISGSVEFGVIKQDQQTTEVPEKTGTVLSNDTLLMPLAQPGQYKLVITLKNGISKTFRDSELWNGINVKWAGEQIAIETKQ